jgi:hypothetical protein
MPHRDHDDTELDDREFPEPDTDDNGFVETVRCPYCRRPVYEEAERCPYCENYLSQEDMPRRPPRWLVIGAFLGLAAALGWILWG